MDVVPDFSDQKAAKIAKDLFGIQGKLSSLNAFEDQNVLIDTGDEKFVLKISNKKISLDDLKSQTALLKHLKTSIPEINFPEVLNSNTGDSISFVDGYPIRLVSWIDGDILGKAPRSSKLNVGIGRYLGLFANACRKFSYPLASRPDDLWNLDNAFNCKIYIEDVDGEDVRNFMYEFFKNYEFRTLPNIENLRKAVIHGDANEQNFIVDKNDATRVAGLIDFGDCQFATHINDLAIAVAYALLGVDDLDQTATEIISGYHAQFSLMENELEVLSDLIIMRLLTSIILTSHRAKSFPDNTYITSSQSSARRALKLVDRQGGVIQFKRPL